jgi:two-component system, chemotaxis family, response regulator Rcp1
MSSETAGTPIEILLVEDNPSDVRMTLETLREFKLRNTVHTVPDGEAAMAFLRRINAYVNVPRPDLILLDLNLPRMKGQEVLAEVKSDPELAAIPVVILTGSRAETDILQAHDLHAHGYITKPVELKEFVSLLNFIDEFGLLIVRMPPKPGLGPASE